MTSKQMEQALANLLMEPDTKLYTDEVEDTGASYVTTFEDGGYLGGNDGVVVRLDDGSEFQLQIVQVA